jgi:hypothetical protein
MTALGCAGVPDHIDPMIAALLSGDDRWVNGERIEASVEWRFRQSGMRGGVSVR